MRSTAASAACSASSSQKNRLASVVRMMEFRPRMAPRILCPALSAVLLSCIPSASAEDRDPHVLASIWENDLLFNPAPGEHQDRHYTQGLKVIYLDGCPTLG
jgi:hypothetical protein